MVASVIGGLRTVLLVIQDTEDLRESEKFFEHTLHLDHLLEALDKSAERR